MRTELLVMRALTRTSAAVASRAELSIRSRLAAQRPAKPLTLCDGHGADFVTVTGQILMAAHMGPGLLAVSPGGE